MKFEKLIGKKVILFTRKNFRFAGIIKDIDEGFLEIFDDLKQKSKIISISEITEVEICDEQASHKL